MNEEEFRQSYKQEGDCLIWTRATGTSCGLTYGYVWWEGKLRVAHRVAFLLHHKRWPNGVAHHECRNTLCGNWEHLTEMSRSDHSFTHNKNTKTHCMHGHEYTEKTTYHRPGGGRTCRICLARRMKAYNLRQKLKQ